MLSGFHDYVLLAVAELRYIEFSVHGCKACSLHGC